MSIIDPPAAHSARRINDPLAKAAIVAKLRADASYAAGILAGLMDGADRDHHVNRDLITALCKADELLTDIAGHLADGPVFVKTQVAA